jgi:hypothetical protein
MEHDILRGFRQLSQAGRVKLKGDIAIDRGRRLAAPHELQAVIGRLEGQRSLFPARKPCCRGSIDLLRNAPDSSDKINGSS